jgi:hypothetical protein
MVTIKLGRNCLGIDQNSGRRGEDFELCGEPQIIAIRRQTIGNPAAGNLVSEKGSDHPGLGRQTANPRIRFN